jgi:hypothetical protein
LLFLILFKLATQILPDRKVGLFKILKTTRNYDMQTSNHYSSRLFNSLPSFTAGVFMALLLFTGPSLQAVDRVGNPLILPGANFSIFALQDINSNPLGIPAFSVNRNFEFPDSIGVTYSLGGKLTDFGIGLYEGAGKATQSTGLEILFNTPVLASTATARVEDFDIEAGKDTFFKDKKVSPSLALLGPGNTILGTALPADIFPNLVPVAGLKDVWDINFAGLLNTLHLADLPINGFVLFADQTAGEHPSSDPYLLISVGNGIVPEPSTYVLVCVGAILAFFVRMRLKRKAIR